ncbi:hypothetical protein SAMN02799630_00786 [Paenibacillus sp. UNCCL117]|uniref:hypothetical protein n=1 Tax=unclassified Paenibacillus TaxID=185978 RepID=UPI00087FFA91|nr:MULTISPECIES: hypothetical protein [unclassified Paenibacillus]SDC20278.1 hypothetical protein SAMN04488602_101586 [Paenibacillus sp. cl123]SFW18584.1 hypothetical protein SAMN02799630_00786 [Paenibacillus sp. UNCCL117]
MLKRIWSLREWGHVFRRIIPLMLSSRVPLGEKLLFALPALIYWIAPDLLPFMPIDDIAFTLLLMNGFTNRAERKYGG